jgi:hypothetical protein
MTGSIVASDVASVVTTDVTTDVTLEQSITVHLIAYLSGNLSPFGLSFAHVVAELSTPAPRHLSNVLISCILRDLPPFCQTLLQRWTQVDILLVTPLDSEAL